MSELVVAYAPEDESRAQAVARALAAAGHAVRPSLTASEADLVLWSRHAASRRGRTRLKPAAVIARLDDAAPPAGVRAYAAVDLRGWRGRADQPAWRALLRKIGGRTAPTMAAATPRPTEPAPAPAPARSGSAIALTLVIGAAAVLAAAGAAYVFIL